MKSMQAVKMAFKAIASNKMRSFLTMLGIIIGVFAVIMLISVGQGATSSVTTQIEGLGSNMLIVGITAKKPYELTLDDLNSLKGIDGISAISPLLSANSKAKAGTKNYDTSIEGASTGYDAIRSLTVKQGRFLKESDMQNRSAVAVIGPELAEKLFGTRDVLGNTFSVLGRDFLIVGVLEEKGSTMGQSNDNKAIIPFTTAQRIMKRTKISQFYVSATSADTVKSVESEVTKFLNRRMDATDSNGNDNYRVFNQSDILGTLNTVTGTLTAMLGGIAGISLLVGGIGIMNIMLVSVSERTREIGIRKAIGAQRSDILMQFLVEAVAISLTGGIIGLGFGYLGVGVLSRVFNMDLTISMGVAALALGFSMMVGVGFGLYPANRASKLRPIEALRYE
jgi:putative ABC transport system permease protein